MFLTQQDFLPLIQPEIKQAISSDQSLWNNAELQAEEEITGYLNTRFDMATAFAQLGTNRNARLVMIMVDIALYHVHSRLTPRNIPEIRESRYEYAIEWLKSANKGSITPKLPLQQDISTGTDASDVRFGSGQKLNHSY